MVEKLVLAGPASVELGKSVAGKLGLGLLEHEFRQFPDGESKFRFESSVAGKSVFIVQSTYPPADQHLMQLMMASHHLSQEGAKVTAVMPYLAYSRQDKEFLPGEVLSLGVVAHLLRAAGVRRVVVVDIHSMEGLSLFSFPIYSVSAVPDLVGYARAHLKLTDPVVISPDFGASKRTEAFAKLYGAKMLQLSKARDRETGEVKMGQGYLEVKGKDVVIVDDIISLGSTATAATELVLRQGAAQVVALCSHALLVGDAAERMKKAGVKTIVGTNSVPGEFSVVDVSDALASHLRTLEE